ncbi:MAG: Methyltransferase domain [Candidatus Parcubacteria bacterium]|jgi:hypothetical protein
MATPLYSILTSAIGEKALVGATVLDVGCARFAESVALRDMGAHVTALDTKRREEAPEGISFIQEDFLQMNVAQPFDIVYMSNVALFMPLADVLEKLRLLNPKMIAVRTMFDYPVPNWNPDELQTLYFSKPADWVNFFEPLGYRTVVAKDYEEETPDMRGRNRIFRYTDYIGIRQEL